MEKGLQVGQFITSTDERWQDSIRRVHAFFYNEKGKKSTCQLWSQKMDGKGNYTGKDNSLLVSCTEEGILLDNENVIFPITAYDTFEACKAVHILTWIPKAKKVKAALETVAQNNENKENEGTKTGITAEELAKMFAGEENEKHDSK